MRTLNEEKAWREESRARKAQERADRVLAIQSQQIPLREGVTEQMRDRIHAVIVGGGASPCGFACDHCKTELYDISGGVVLTSYPPQRRIGCPGCGWTGTTSL
jgi:hypothetical protein